MFVFFFFFFLNILEDEGKLNFFYNSQVQLKYRGYK